jgi:hypothetical protein
MAVVVEVVAAVITGAVDVVVAIGVVLFLIVTLPLPPCSKTKFLPLIEAF